MFREPVPVVIVETLMGYNLEEIIDWRPAGCPRPTSPTSGRQLASALHYLHARATSTSTSAPPT